MHLQDKSFVVLGRLKASRSQVFAVINAAGGQVQGNVSSKTDYVVYGKATGSQYMKAVSMGVPCLTEDEFFALIRGEELSSGAAGVSTLETLIGEARSLQQHPPSEQVWLGCADLLDACRDGERDALTHHILAHVASWNAETMRGHTGHSVRAEEAAQHKGSYHYSFLRSRFGMSQELRVAPLSWIGQMVRGVANPKYAIIHAVDLRTSKISPTQTNKLLKHPSLTHLRTLLLSMEKLPTKTLVKTLCTHHNLHELHTLGIGKVNQDVVQEFKAHSKARQLKHLNLRDAQPVYRRISLLKELTGLVHAPLFETIEELTLWAQQTYTPPLLTHIATQDLFPALHILRLRDTWNLNVTRAHGYFKSPLMRRIGTLDMGELTIRDKELKELAMLVDHSLPEGLHTLDLSHLDFDADRPASDPFLTQMCATLLKGRWLDHVQHIELGKLADLTDISDLCALYRPEITWRR